MEESQSEQHIIKLESSDDGGSSSQKNTGSSKGEKFLRRIRWKSLTPSTALFSVEEESIGDLSLYSAELYKEYIICVGGTSQTHAPFKGYRFIPTLHVTDSYTAGCCCCTGQWSLAGAWKYREARGDIPPMRYGQKTALVNNTLFMFGGRIPGAETLLNDFYSLDLESMIWTKLQPKGDTPSPRIRHTLTYVDGFLYLLGGNGQNASIFVKDSLWRYDIRATSWDMLPTPPTHDGVIAGHAAAASDQGILVFGGSSSIFGREPHELIFDTVSGRWQTISVQNSVFYGS
jgi:hypothetical protein